MRLLLILLTLMNLAFGFMTFKKVMEPKPEITVDEKTHNFLQCFYDTVLKNQPSIMIDENGGYLGKNFLDHLGLIWVEAVCIGKTGADLRFTEPKYMLEPRE